MGAFSRRMNDRTGKASALVCATKKDSEDAGFILKAGGVDEAPWKTHCRTFSTQPHKEKEKRVIGHAAG